MVKLKIIQALQRICCECLELLYLQAIYLYLLKNLIFIIFNFYSNKDIFYFRKFFDFFLGNNSHFLLNKILRHFKENKKKENKKNLSYKKIQKLPRYKFYNKSKFKYNLIF